jgi:hypothetical protein
MLQKACERLSVVNRKEEGQGNTPRDVSLPPGECVAPPVLLLKYLKIVLAKRFFPYSVSEPGIGLGTCASITNSILSHYRYF